MVQRLGIRGEQRESFIEDLMLTAELPHLAVPPESRETAVLNERRRFHSGGQHLLKMPERNIADADSTRAAGVSLFEHGRPHF